MMGIPERYRADAARAAQPDHRARRRRAAALAAAARPQPARAGPAAPGGRPGSGGSAAGSPTDDLISALVTASVDGKRLNSRELGVVLLAAAGGRRGDHPQRDRARAAPAHRATRRSARCCSATSTSTGAASSRRSCGTRRRSSSSAARSPGTTSSTGTRCGAGDEVVLFYNSANRDETVFADPDRFDITRSPNPHVGFGGGGPHFCLGTVAGPAGDVGAVPRAADPAARDPLGRRAGTRSVQLRQPGRPAALHLLRHRERDTDHASPDAR